MEMIFSLSCETDAGNNCNDLITSALIIKLKIEGRNGICSKFWLFHRESVVTVCVGVVFLNRYLHTFHMYLF